MVPFIYQFGHALKERSDVIADRGFCTTREQARWISRRSGSPQANGRRPII